MSTPRPTGNRKSGADGNMGRKQFSYKLSSAIKQGATHEVTPCFFIIEIDPPEHFKYSLAFDRLVNQ
ncbi:hypothetical protein JYT79_01675 [Cardiobacterium sp. AH-315-I02]|nr:hypothetical protein [Cardiobacterium sp. AH-315-I02]